MPTNSSNSSNVVTHEDVTLTSSPHALIQESPKIFWLITLKAKDISNSSIRSWIEMHCESAVWQLEQGSNSDYLHYQLSLKLKKKNRLSWLKNHFCKIAHCEFSENIEKCFNYCQKNESRIAGPFYYPAPISTIVDPMDGLIYHDWQITILNIINKTPDNRTIHWFWEAKGNIGKTSFCKHLVLTRDATYVLGKKADIYYAINNNINILLIDIPRTIEGKIDYLYEILESVKNGMIFSGKYESKTKIFNPPHVIVFSNFPPNQSMLSADRWAIYDLNISESTSSPREIFNPLDADF